jgi:hypothetical protein
MATKKDVSKMSRTEKKEIADEIITAIAFSVPNLNFIAKKEVGISASFVLVLMHLRLFGVELDRPTMLRQDLTTLMEKWGSNGVHASRIVRDLELRKFIRLVYLSDKVRKESFPQSASGRVNRMAVELTDAGELKIAEFVGTLRYYFEQWLVEGYNLPRSKKNPFAWLVKTLKVKRNRQHITEMSKSLIEHFGGRKLSR